MLKKFLIYSGISIVFFLIGCITYLSAYLEQKEQAINAETKLESVIGGVRAIQSEFEKIYRAGSMEQVNEAILHGDRIRSGLKAILDVK